MKRILLNTVKTVIPLGIGIFLTWKMWHDMTPADRENLKHAILHADYLWVVISIFIGWFSHYLRALRWKYTLTSIGVRYNPWTAYHSVMAAYAINLTVPRSGEVSRAVLYSRNEGGASDKVLGTIAAERIVDLLMLGLIIVVALVLQGGHMDTILAKAEAVQASKEAMDAQASGSAPGVFSSFWFWAGSLASILLLVVIFVPGIRARAILFSKGVLEGLSSMWKMEHRTRFVLITIAIWALYVVMFQVCFYCFEETSGMPAAGMLVAFIAGTFAIVILPGGIGGYPLLVGIVVGVYLYPDSPAAFGESGPGQAVGWLMWASQNVLVVVGGVISILWLNFRIKKKENEQVPEQVVEH